MVSLSVFVFRFRAVLPPIICDCHVRFGSVDALLVKCVFFARYVSHALISIVLVQSVEHLTVRVERRSLAEEAIRLHLADPLLAISECQCDESMGKPVHPSSCIGRIGASSRCSYPIWFAVICLPTILTLFRAKFYKAVFFYKSLLFPEEFENFW